MKSTLSTNGTALAFDKAGARESEPCLCLTATARLEDAGRI